MPEEKNEKGFILDCQTKRWYQRYPRGEAFQFFDWEDALAFVKKEYGITREEQDALALSSQNRAEAAKKAGKSVDDAAASFSVAKYVGYKNENVKAAMQVIYDESK